MACYARRLLRAPSTTSSIYTTHSIGFVILRLLRNNWCEIKHMRTTACTKHSSSFLLQIGIETPVSEAKTHAAGNSKTVWNFRGFHLNKQLSLKSSALQVFCVTIAQLVCFDCCDGCFNVCTELLLRSGILFASVAMDEQIGFLLHFLVFHKVRV